jgi:hypothetical protein
MSDLEQVVQEIGRTYTKKRIELSERFKFEFDTPEKRRIMNDRISELDKQYQQQVREKKIEHILK